jgi:uroporphyrinogen decarboxylase
MPTRAALGDSPFLAACRGERGTRTPVWFMRQAGRSLPEYRALRMGKTFHEMLVDPRLAAEVTMQPVRRHGVDAAIFFSDIITPVQSFVPGVSIEQGRGPVINEPFRTLQDVDRLRAYDPLTHTPFVADAIRLCVDELDPMGIPLIGFAGAPFTVATYIVEGGKSKEFEHTKSMMHSEPEVWHALMTTLSDIALLSLRAQIGAGASAVQLFDSWAGILSKREYERFVQPYSARVFAGLADTGVPRIHFGVGTGELLGAMGEAGADVVGVDWRVSLPDARARVGPGRALQGNLDPVVLLAPWHVVQAEIDRVLEEAAQAGGGHIFNLGHGVLPQIAPETLTRVVDYVHSITSETR